MRSVHIRTALPGPKAQALLQRDAQVVSPSYPRDCPFAMSHGKGAEVWDVDEALTILTASLEEAQKDQGRA